MAGTAFSWNHLVRNRNIEKTGIVFYASQHPWTDEQQIARMHEKRKKENIIFTADPTWEKEQIS